jgi:hypothetical protein
MNSSTLLLVLLILCQNGVYSQKKTNKSKRPNIIFILMDDLDIQLGSMRVMTKTRAMFERHGTEFVNAFVTSPICCPSRSSILTGMYAHNHGCLTNTVNCASMTWRRGPEKRNFGYYLQQSGYRTGKSKHCSFTSEYRRFYVSIIVFKLLTTVSRLAERIWYIYFLTAENTVQVF